MIIRIRSNMTNGAIWAAAGLMRPAVRLMDRPITSPPTSAPGIDSSPPRSTAGKAAIPTVLFSMLTPRR